VAEINLQAEKEEKRLLEESKKAKWHTNNYSE
jgi:hypothetical protein